MATPWSYRVDGLELNDGTSFVTEGVLGLQDGPAYDDVLVDMQDDFPEFIRSQPVGGRFVVNVVCVQSVGSRPAPCTDAQWLARIASLEAVLGPGLHDFDTLSRGMVSRMGCRVSYRSKGTNVKERRVSIELGVPKPVLTAV